MVLSTSLEAKDATLRLSVSAGLRLRTSVFAVCQRGLGEDYLQLAGASSPNRPNTTHAACHCLRRRIVIRRVVRDAGTAAGPITSAVHRMKCYGLVLALCWTRRGAAKVLHGSFRKFGLPYFGVLIIRILVLLSRLLG